MVGTASAKIRLDAVGHHGAWGMDFARHRQSRGLISLMKPPKQSHGGIQLKLDMKSLIPNLETYRRATPPLHW